MGLLPFLLSPSLSHMQRPVQTQHRAFHLILGFCILQFGLRYYLWGRYDTPSLAVKTVKDGASRTPQKNLLSEIHRQKIK